MIVRLLDVDELLGCEMFRDAAALELEESVALGPVTRETERNQ
jgi:hypothetical protein